MQKTTILYIGRNQYILDTVVRLLNKNEAWLGFGAFTDEEAIALFGQHAFDMVLLGCGIESASEETLRQYFISQQPSIIIVQHYGGGSGLLATEIALALQTKNN